MILTPLFLLMLSPSAKAGGQKATTRERAWVACAACCQQAEREGTRCDSGTKYGGDAAANSRFAAIQCQR